MTSGLIIAGLKTCTLQFSPCLTAKVLSINVTDDSCANGAIGLMYR